MFGVKIRIFKVKDSQDIFQPLIQFEKIDQYYHYAACWVTLIDKIRKDNFLFLSEKVHLGFPL